MTDEKAGSRPPRRSSKGPSTAVLQRLQRQGESVADVRAALQAYLRRGGHDPDTAPSPSTFQAFAKTRTRKQSATPVVPRRRSPRPLADPAPPPAEDAEAAPAAQVQEPLPAENDAEQAEDVYLAAALQAVEEDEDSSDTAVAGMLIDGVTGLLRPTMELLLDLERDTLALLRSARVSGEALSAVMGGWAWVALACRPLFAVFHAVYIFIQRFFDQATPLWRSAADELTAALGLLPLVQCDLRAPWAPWALATDASEHGVGVVAASVSAAEQRRVARASVVLPEGLGSDVPFLGSHWPWRIWVAAPWSFSIAHNTVLELQALLTGISALVSRPSGQGVRVLVFCDNSAVVGAVAKGRSSASSLSPLLRKLTALLLVWHVRLEIRYVHTSSNPADGPSRTFRPSF